MNRTTLFNGLILNLVDCDIENDCDNSLRRTSIYLRKHCIHHDDAHAYLRLIKKCGIKCDCQVLAYKNELKEAWSHIKGLCDTKPCPSPSEQIKNLRKITGMTQAQFAKHFKISYRSLRNWESGISKPPQGMIYLIDRVMEEEKISKPDSDDTSTSPRDSSISLLFPTWF